MRSGQGAQLLLWWVGQRLALQPPQRRGGAQRGHITGCEHSAPFPPPLPPFTRLCPQDMVGRPGAGGRDVFMRSCSTGQASQIRGVPRNSGMCLTSRSPQCEGFSLASSPGQVTHQLCDLGGALSPSSRFHFLICAVSSCLCLGLLGMAFRRHSAQSFTHPVPTAVPRLDSGGRFSLMPS